MSQRGNHLQKSQSFGAGRRQSIGVEVDERKGRKRRETLQLDDVSFPEPIEIELEGDEPSFLDDLCDEDWHISVTSLTDVDQCLDHIDALLQDLNKIQGSSSHLAVTSSFQRATESIFRSLEVAMQSILGGDSADTDDDIITMLQDLICDELKVCLLLSQCATAGKWVQFCQPLARILPAFYSIEIVPILDPEVRKCRDQCSRSILTEGLGWPRVLKTINDLISEKDESKHFGIFSFLEVLLDIDNPELHKDIRQYMDGSLGKSILECSRSDNDSVARAAKQFVTRVSAMTCDNDDTKNAPDFNTSSSMNGSTFSTPPRRGIHIPMPDSKRRESIRLEDEKEMEMVVPTNFMNSIVASNQQSDDSNRSFERASAFKRSASVPHHRAAKTFHPPPRDRGATRRASQPAIPIEKLHAPPQPQRASDDTADSILLNQVKTRRRTRSVEPSSTRKPWLGLDLNVQTMHARGQACVLKGRWYQEEKSVHIEIVAKHIKVNPEDVLIMVNHGQLSVTLVDKLIVDRQLFGRIDESNFETEVVPRVNKSFFRITFRKVVVQKWVTIFKREGHAAEARGGQPSKSTSNLLSVDRGRSASATSGIKASSVSPRPGNLLSPSKNVHARSSSSGTFPGKISRGNPSPLIVSFNAQGKGKVFRTAMEKLAKYPQSKLYRLAAAHTSSTPIPLPARVEIVQILFDVFERGFSVFSELDNGHLMQDDFSQFCDALGLDTIKDAFVQLVKPAASLSHISENKEETPSRSITRRGEHHGRTASLPPRNLTSGRLRTQRSSSRGRIASGNSDTMSDISDMDFYGGSNNYQAMIEAEQWEEASVFGEAPYVPENHFRDSLQDAVQQAMECLVRHESQAAYHLLVDALRSEERRLTNKAARLEKAKMQIISHRETVKRAQQEMEDRNQAHVQQLYNAKDKLRKFREKQRQIAVDNEKQTKELEFEREMLVKQKETFESDRKEQQASGENLKRWKEQLESDKEKLQASVAQVKVWKDRVAAQEDKNKEDEEEIRKLQDLISGAKDTFQSELQEFDDMKARVIQEQGEKEKEILARIAELDERESQLANEKQLLDELRKEPAIREIQERLDTAIEKEKANVDASEAIAKRESELAERESALKDLEQSVESREAQAEADLNFMNQQKMEQEESVLDLEKKEASIHSLEKSLNERQEELNALESRLKEESDKLVAERDAHTTQFEDRMENETGELAQKQRDLELKLAELTEREDHVRQDAARMASEEKDLHQRRSTLKRREDVLELEKENVRTEKEVLKSRKEEVQALQRELARGEREAMTLTTLEEDKQNLQHELSAASEQIETLQREIATLRTEAETSKRADSLPSIIRTTSNNIPKGKSTPIIRRDSASGPLPNGSPTGSTRSMRSSKSESPFRTEE